MPLNKPYNYGAYNKYNETEQWIRLSEGCPNGCPFCYEPKKYKTFKIPKIVRNKVKIMDMNLLCKDEALSIILSLGEKRVDKKVIHYELICGIDYRYLNQDMAILLHNNRFKNIRLAWDFGMRDQYKIKDSIKFLTNAGYRPKEIMVFMICNWKIRIEECCQKLDLCKIWNVKVADCYFDGQISPNIKPEYWIENEIKSFRKKCRKHNQLINFGIDPEIKNKEKEV